MSTRTTSRTNRCSNLLQPFIEARKPTPAVLEALDRCSNLLQPFIEAIVTPWH